MEWNVAQLLKSASGTERTYEFDEEERRFRELASRVVGVVRLMKTDRAILAIATVDTAVWCECSRCLSRFAHPLHLAFAEEFYPILDINTGLPQRDARAEGAFMLDEQHVLDLGEPVFQHAILNTPMKPLCAAVCRGLCPSCGANLNQGACGCPKLEGDSRWAELEGLKGQLQT